MNRNINYDENKNLEDEDIGFDSPLYDINLYDKHYLITVGKERKLVAKKNHYYFPVYLVNEKMVYRQIGAFEFESVEKTQENRSKTFLDKEGDLDLNRLGDLILYSFANYDFFKSLDIQVNVSKVNDIETAYQMKSKKRNLADLEKSSDSDSDDESPLEIHSKDIKKTKEMEKSDTVLKDGIFTKELSMKLPANLLEETKIESKKNKKEFKDSSKAEWIEKFMKNNNYDIVETADNGDCLFDTVRLAYQQIGYKTSIEKLRAVVANEADEAIFEQYRNIYLSAVSQKDNIPRDMKMLKKTNLELKKRMENAGTREEKVQIKKDAEEVAKKYKFLKEDQESTDELLKEFVFMEGIDDLEKLRALIKTSTYWADTWAITVLENKLNVKILLLSEQSYDTGDLNSVLQCGQENDEVDPDTEISPPFYIMTTYSGNHYRLVSYKQKYIFKFSEIPYDVKIMVVIKCMEKNAGPYYRIREFRKFKADIGISTSTSGNDREESSGNDGEEDQETRLSYDPNVVFMYYNKSSGVPKAGKGSNEKISETETADYAELNAKKHKDWRKMLDDAWHTEFSLDGMKWKTVEHYYQGAKFKSKNRKFYELFSIDSGNEIGQDVEFARVAGSASGKKKSVVLRPATIKIDPDFYGSRNNEEREKALYAKFSQNQDLKEKLLLTKNAKLTHFIPKDEPEVDRLLMKVRKAIQNEKR